MEGFLNDMSDEDEEHSDDGGELLVIMISIIDPVLNSLVLPFLGCGIKIKATCWEMFDNLTLTICAVFYIQVLESLVKDIKYNLSRVGHFFPECVSEKKSLF